MKIDWVASVPADPVEERIDCVPADPFKEEMDWEAIVPADPVGKITDWVPVSWGKVVKEPNALGRVSDPVRARPRELVV